MKKVGLFLASAVIVAASLTSCIKKAEVDTETARTNGSAVISGVIVANTNKVIDTISGYQPWPASANLEYVSGAKVIVTYNSASLNPSNVNNENVTVSDITDANGEYSISIPANGTSVNATVWVQDMDIDVKTLVDSNNDFFIDAADTPESVRTAFSAGNQGVTVVSGDRVVVDFTLF